MTYDEIKKWLEDNNYQNSGLRNDRNHRIDLYLSDVLFDFAQQQVKNLNIPAVMVELPTAIEVYNQAKECSNSLWFVKWFKKRFGGN
jgi:hypothetical protein